jgi:hypothetical protein
MKHMRNYSWSCVAYKWTSWLLCSEYGQALGQRGRSPNRQPRMRYVSNRKSRFLLRKFYFILCFTEIYQWLSLYMIRILLNEMGTICILNVTPDNNVLQHFVALLSVISSICISVTIQYKIVTVTLIFIRDMFRPYTAIIRCPRYAKLFTELPVSVLKLKLRLKFKLK